MGIMRGLRLFIVLSVSASVLMTVGGTSTATAIGHPGRPTAVLAVGIDEAIAVSWNAPVSDGGSPITGYTVTAKGDNTCSTTGATTCLVTGLTNGKRYSV